MTDGEVKAAVTTFVESLGFSMAAVCTVAIQPGHVEVVYLDRPDPIDPSFKVRTTTDFTWTPGPACYPPSPSGHRDG